MKFLVIALVMVAINVLITGCSTVPVAAPALHYVNPPVVPQVSPPAHRSVPYAWNNETWDAKLDGLVTVNLPAFMPAKEDMKRFCPNFDTLDQDGQVHAIGTMLVALAKSESDWNPMSSSVDVGNKGDEDTYSVGLFSMSVVDQQYDNFNMGFTYKDLLDGVNNIQLAVYEAAYRVQEKGGVITSGCDNKSARGMATYWSTMRSNECGTVKYHDLAAIIKASQQAPGCL